MTSATEMFKEMGGKFGNGCWYFPVTEKAAVKAIGAELGARVFYGDTMVALQMPADAAAQEARLRYPTADDYRRWNAGSGCMNECAE